jgi:hypothetical protein
MGALARKILDANGNPVRQPFVIIA